MRSRTPCGSASRSQPTTVAVPAVGSQQRGQHPQGGRLAGAVGAEEADDFARLRPVTSTPQHGVDRALLGGERAGQPARLDDGHCAVLQLVGTRGFQEERAEPRLDGRSIFDRAQQEHGGACALAHAEKASRAAVAEGQAVGPPITGVSRHERPGDHRLARIAQVNRQVLAEQRNPDAGPAPPPAQGRPRASPGRRAPRRCARAAWPARRRRR